MSRLVQISFPIKLILDAFISDSKKDTFGSYKVPFEVLEIEPLAQMKERIKKEVLNSGFKEQNEGLLVKTYPDGHTAKLNIETMEMLVKIKFPEAISDYFIDESIEGSASIRRREIVEKNLSLDTENGQYLIQKVKAEFEPVLQKMVTKASLEVNKAMKKAYKDALLKKAESMGKIKSVQESKKGNTSKIRVQVIEH